MGPVVVTLLVGGVIGRFVVGFASGETFSAMWAGVGAIATLGAALLLGWRFHVAEEKKKREELPPEIRGVFDRMLGVERDASGRVVNDPNGVFTQLQERANDRSAVAEMQGLECATSLGLAGASCGCGQSATVNP